MAGCRVTGVQAVTGAWESAICAVRIRQKPRDAMTMWRADERRCEAARWDESLWTSPALHKGIGLGSGVLYQSVACKLRRGSRQKRVGWIIVRVSYVFDTMLVHGQQTGYSYVVFWPF